MKTNRLRLCIGIALGVLLAAVGVLFIRNLIDFPVYYRAGRSLLAGRSDLYAEDFALGRVMDYRYPPLFLLLFYPLWLLPYKIAAYLWHLFSVAQIVALVAMTRRILAPHRLTRSAWLVVFLATAAYFVIILHYGNAHLLAVTAMIAALYLFLKGRESLAALSLALAITIKLVPGFLLLYFLLKKNWRVPALTLVFLLLLNLAPTLYFGFEKNQQLLANWYQHVVANQEFHEVNGPINLSLKGQLRRYLTEVDYQQRVDGDTRYRAVNIAALSLATVKILWLALSAAAVGAAVALIWFTGRGRLTAGEEGESSGWRALLEIGLLVCLMLLIAPLTSKIYFIALLVPVMALAGVGFDQQHPARRVAGILSFIVAAANVVLPLLPGRSIQRLLLVLGADFYLNLLLLAGISYSLWRGRRLPAMRDGEPQRQSP